MSNSAAKQEKKKAKNKTRTSVGVVNGAGPAVGGSVGVVNGAGPARGVVNEQKVDLLLDMLKSADVTDTSEEESKTVKQLESELFTHTHHHHNTHTHTPHTLDMLYEFPNTCH